MIYFLVVASVRGFLVYLMARGLTLEILQAPHAHLFMKGSRVCMSVTIGDYVLCVKV